MTRDLSSITLDNIESDVVYPFFAVELQFDGGQNLRMWTGAGTLTLPDGSDWVGTGTLLNISAVEETAEMAAKGVTLTLSSVPSTVLSLALSEPYQGRKAFIYFGTLSSGKLLKEDDSFILLQDGSKILVQTGESGFNTIFSGYMDQMNIEESADSSALELTIESRLIDLERSRIRRYTSADQKSRYPTDLGLDFVESLQTTKTAWGKVFDT